MKEKNVAYFKPKLYRRSWKDVTCYESDDAETNFICCAVFTFRLSYKLNAERRGTSDGGETQASPLKEVAENINAASHEDHQDVGCNVEVQSQSDEEESEPDGTPEDNDIDNVPALELSNDDSDLLQNVQEIMSFLEDFRKDIKTKLQQDQEQFMPAVQTFMRNYYKISTDAEMISALCCFGNFHQKPGKRKADNDVSAAISTKRVKTVS